MNFKIVSLQIVSFLAILLTSCREEIVSPQKIESSSKILNYAFESSTPNTYTFQISAENNSSNYVNELPILKTLNLYFVVSNYSSGSINIKLTDRNQRPIYNNIYSSNINNASINLDDLLPTVIRLELNNFSGDFSLNLSGNP